MDHEVSLHAASCFLGTFTLLKQAAEDNAKGKPAEKRQVAEIERVCTHLHHRLPLLPMHMSLEKMVSEWRKQRNQKFDRCFNWKQSHPSRATAKQKYRYDHLFGVCQLLELADRVYEINNAGQLCQKNDLSREELTKVFSLFPQALLRGVRFAMEPGRSWEPGQRIDERINANHEFESFLDRDLADPHIHCSLANLYPERFLSAIRGIALPLRIKQGCYPQTGKTDYKTQFQLENRKIRPLLLACKSAWRLLLEFIKVAPSCPFEAWINQLSGHPSVDFNQHLWKHAIDNSLEISSSYRLELLIIKHWNLPDRNEEFFQEKNSFDYLWYKITRQVLRAPEDSGYSYAYIQLCRCVCDIYRLFYHREGFYEFQRTISIDDSLEAAIGTPNGRLPTRTPVSKYGQRFLFDSFQRSSSLQQIQLRIAPNPKKSHKSRVFSRKQRKSNRSPRITRSTILHTLLAQLATYRDYLQSLFPKNLSARQSRCRHCGEIVRKTVCCPFCTHAETDQVSTEPTARKPILAVYPIHLLRKPDEENGTKAKPPCRWEFKSSWKKAEVLADLFSKDTVLRLFFGRLDVAGHEDEMPNWPFALIFQEFHERLCRKTSSDAQDNPVPKFQYNCHAGEHFHSSIHGLRRIWEAVEFFPNLHGIGHAMALGIDDRWPHEMPEDELLDDLVWIFANRQYLPNGESSIITLETRRIAKSFHGKACSIHDLHEAYFMRFDREKIAEHTGILRAVNAPTGMIYQYLDPRFRTFSTGDPAAELLRNHLKGSSNRSVKECQLSKDLKDELIKAYAPLRERVMDMIREKGVIIECCPSSNLRIGNLKNFQKHPVFSFNSPGDKRGLPVQIATDDPAVFQSTIEEQYAAIWESLCKNYGSLSITDRLEWMENIRKRGMDYCCGELPSYCSNGDCTSTILDLIDQCFKCYKKP